MSLKCSDQLSSTTRLNLIKFVGQNSGFEMEGISVNEISKFFFKDLKNQKLLLIL